MYPSTPISESGKPLPNPPSGARLSGIATGAFTTSHTDLALAGRLGPLAFTRVHDSYAATEGVTSQPTAPPASGLASDEAEATPVNTLTFVP